MSENLNGVVVNGFQIGPLVGYGGFADVYRATAPKGDPCMLKVARVGPPPSATVELNEVDAEALFCYTGTSTARPPESEHEVNVVLVEEFETLRCLSLGLFPSLYGIGYVKGRLYYAMEAIPGGSLRQWMREPGLREEIVGMVAELMASLLRAADDVAGFYHGDLKPENIILCGTRLRPIDPGLRYTMDRFPTATLSPQYNPLGFSGERADTLALAILLFEVLVGERPFTQALPNFTSNISSNAQLRERLDLGRFEKYRETPVVASLIPWFSAPPPGTVFLDTLRALDTAGHSK